MQFCSNDPDLKRRFNFKLKKQQLSGVQLLVDSHIVLNARKFKEALLKLRTKCFILGLDVGKTVLCCRDVTGSEGNLTKNCGGEPSPETLKTKCGVK